MSDFELFSEWEKKQIEETGGVSEEVQKNLHGSINFFQFLGSCIELFIPKMLLTAAAMIGSDADLENTEHE
ncbi:MAG: hypothetical protein J5I59_04860 [Saprospiraceae bacterium]|nr:hypothetical protein [Saprospiraceae bacterium]